MVTVTDKGNAVATEINRTRPVFAVPTQQWDANSPKQDLQSVDLCIKLNVFM